MHVALRGGKRMPLCRRLIVLGDSVAIEVCNAEIVLRINQALLRGERPKFHGLTNIAGRTLVLLKLYWKNGRIKAEIGVAQGKEARDKRLDLKKRATDRETAREVARFNRKHG